MDPVLPPALAQFLGLGVGEWLIILLIVVVFFGAAKIPQLARSLGKAKGEFAKGMREGTDEARREESEDERVLRAARELGIPTEGRPLEDVKRDLRAKMG